MWCFAWWQSPPSQGQLHIIIGELLSIYYDMQLVFIIYLSSSLYVSWAPVRYHKICCITYIHLDCILSFILDDLPSCNCTQLCYEWPFICLAHHKYSCIIAITQTCDLAKLTNLIATVQLSTRIIFNAYIIIHLGINSNTRMNESWRSGTAYSRCRTCKYWSCTQLCRGVRDWSVVGFQEVQNQVTAEDNKSCDSISTGRRAPLHLDN